MTQCKQVGQASSPDVMMTSGDAWPTFVKLGLRLILLVEQSGTPSIGQVSSVNAKFLHRLEACATSFPILFLLNKTGFYWVIYHAIHFFLFS